MLSQDDKPTAVARLTVAWATTLVVLIAVTWPLWTPLRDVPRVALFGAPPAFIEFAMLAAIGGGLLLNRLRRPATRRGIGIATLALLLLMAFDQLRWQPWAYHALIVGAMLAMGNARRTIGGLRLVAIAVYAYSAIAKLDAEFVATLGRQMVGVLVRSVGIDPSSISDSLINTLALSLPVGELALAVLLAASLRWNQLTKPACVLVVLTHATTIAVLSPWGLVHSLGVLLWNVGFAWQTIVLFGSALPDTEASPLPSPFTPFGQAALVVLAVLAPIGTPFGLWDQWPGWALYAPGGERATLFVHTAATDRLPDSLQKHLDPEPEAASPWRLVRLDDWVLEATGAPIYPQNRVVAAIAAGLLERYPLTDRVRVIAESTADRVTRDRSRAELTNRGAIQEAATVFGVDPAVMWPR